MADHSAINADHEGDEHIECWRDRRDADRPAHPDQPDPLRERVREIDRVRGVAEHQSESARPRARGRFDHQCARNRSHRRNAVRDDALQGEAVSIDEADPQCRGRDKHQSCRAAATHQQRRNDGQHDPGEKLQHDWIDIGAQHRTIRLEYLPDRDQSQEDRREQREAQARPWHEQAETEQQIEKHLIVQRPAERVDRRGKPKRRMCRRDEQERFYDVHGIELYGKEALRRDQRSRDVGGGENPVERNDAHDAREPERERPAVATLGRCPHDIAGDHEEQIDAHGAEMRRVVNKRRNAHGVLERDQARGDRAQVLNRDDRFGAGLSAVAVSH